MPRRMQTEPDLPAEELPDLTDRQLAFVQGILAGKSATDAYRAAYDCSNMGKNSVWVEASRARHHPDIALWLAAARKANQGIGKVTLSGHLQELERLRELALESGNIGAAVQAEQIRGKAAGLHIDKVQEVPADHDPMVTLDNAAAELGEDVALSLAKNFGLTSWKPPSARGADTRH